MEKNIQKAIKLSIKSSLHDRIREGNQKETLVLLLDRSGSMAGERIDALKKATELLVNEVDFTKYNMSIHFFPPLQSSLLKIGNPFVIINEVNSVMTGGNTPMAEAIDKVIGECQRAILVSDGEPTDNPLALLKRMKENCAKMPIIDCVHIGDSPRSEETLRTIAQETGGTYQKFTDLEKLKKSFKYLSPKYYGLLREGKIGG